MDLEQHTAWLRRRNDNHSGFNGGVGWSVEQNTEKEGTYTSDTAKVRPVSSSVRSLLLGKSSSSVTSAGGPSIMYILSTSASLPAVSLRCLSSLVCVFPGWERFLKQRNSNLAPPMAAAAARRAGAARSSAVRGDEDA